MVTVVPATGPTEGRTRGNGLRQWQEGLGFGGGKQSLASIREGGAVPGDRRA